MTMVDLDSRLEEWARWCQVGGCGAGLWWKRHAAGLNNVIQSTTGRGLSPTADREEQVEVIVASLAQVDLVAAEVLRAEYHAAPRYGNPDYDNVSESRRKECKRIGIAESTYRQKLATARTVVATQLTTEVLTA